MTTSPPKLIESTVSFADNQLLGLFCRPEGDAAWPGVVLIHDIYGLREHLKGVARGLASEGFAVFAPHFLARFRRDAFDPTAEVKVASSFCQSISQEQIRKDIDAALHTARSQEGVLASRMAVWGYCWGGSAVFSTLADRADLSAGAVFYGGLPEERTPNMPRRPFDCVSAIRTPLILHYGEADTGIPVGRALRLQSLLRTMGKHFEFYTYPGAPHAFCDETRDNYVPEAAALAWKRTITFLKKHLSGDRP